MIGNGSALAIASVIGALIIVLYNFRGHRLSTHKVLRYALIWGAVILALVLVLRVTGA